MNEKKRKKMKIDGNKPKWKKFYLQTKYVSYTFFRFGKIVDHSLKLKTILNIRDALFPFP